jgi:hypothetical protein
MRYECVIFIFLTIDKIFNLRISFNFTMSDGGSMVFQNVGILRHHYMASQPRRWYVLNLHCCENLIFHIQVNWTELAQVLDLYVTSIKHLNSARESLI